MCGTIFAASPYCLRIITTITVNHVCCEQKLFYDIYRINSSNTRPV
jgi:hypothetical protein